MIYVVFAEIVFNSFTDASFLIVLYECTRTFLEDSLCELDLQLSYLLIC